MYPIDRRKIALHIYSLIGSLRKTAVLVQTSHTTIARWLKCIERKTYTRKNITKATTIVDIIKNLIKANPFMPIRTMKKCIHESLSVDVSISLLRSVIRISGYTRKKARNFYRPPDYASKEKIFLEKRKNFVEQGKVFISLDETSFGRNHKSVYGYSMKGHQLKIQRSNYVNTNSYMAMISDSKVLAIGKNKKSYCTHSFYEFLCSYDFPRNAVLLLDNVRFHHSSVIKEYASMIDLELLYVPPYSPWYNPIEGVFSIVKRHFYKYYNVNAAFESVTQQHCCAFFRHSMNLKPQN